MVNRREDGNSPWTALAVVLPAAFVTMAMMTGRSYLRPALLEVPEKVFVASLGASFVFFLVLVARRLRRLPPHPDSLAGWVFLALLLPAALFAGSTLGLLAAVRFGPSTFVEFRSVAMQPKRSRQCKLGFAFDNHPIGRITPICADDVGLWHVRDGEPIIVREQVGTLGGTVVSIQPDRPAAKNP